MPVLMLMLITLLNDGTLIAIGFVSFTMQHIVVINFIPYHFIMSQIRQCSGKTNAGEVEFARAVFSLQCVGPDRLGLVPAVAGADAHFLGRRPHLPRLGSRRPVVRTDHHSSLSEGVYLRLLDTLLCENWRRFLLDELSRSDIARCRCPRSHGIHGHRLCLAAVGSRWHLRTGSRQS